VFTALILACLSAGPMSTPVACRSTEMLIYQPMPTMAYLEAQNRAVAWMKRYPGLRLVGLTLRPGRGV
jgi:hypothetical protein